MGSETGSVGPMNAINPLMPARPMMPQAMTPQVVYNPAASILEQLGKFYQQIYDKAANYTRVILSIGYVGFFAALSATKDQLNNRQAITSALLITLSLVFYVLFEVFQMLYQARWMMQLRKLVMAKPSQLTEALEEYNKKERRGATTLVRVWAVALVLTVVPGFSAAAILVYAFFLRTLSLLAK